MSQPQKLPKDILDELDKSVGHNIYETEVMVNAMKDLPKFIQQRYDLLIETDSLIRKEYINNLQLLTTEGLDNHSAQASAKETANQRKIIMERKFPAKVYGYAVKKLSDISAKKIDIQRFQNREPENTEL
jgi:hypothetical protein